MSFEYPNTCPDIDHDISKSKETLFYSLHDMIHELCPRMSSETINSVADEYTDALYNEIESIFESVRNTNVKMREEAERQIECLENDVEDLQKKVTELEEVIENYESEYSI